MQQILCLDERDILCYKLVLFSIDRPFGALLFIMFQISIVYLGRCPIQIVHGKAKTDAVFAFTFVILNIVRLIICRIGAQNPNDMTEETCTLDGSKAKEEFENLCLILGIELDAVTTEKAINRKEKHIEEEEADDDEEVIYK
ncbi:unnamed protein product [Brassica rapa]|uniref:Uncharacterized protein n=2 Tax=Brassica campestris TaxID=3711 RepID=A0A8D9GQE4_BRACM|nr:unnamed protein product [Brassica rapa]